MPLYEQVHRASPDMPYLDPDVRNLHYPLHLHEEVEIVQVHRGEVILETDSGQYTAGTADICLITPGVLHGYMSRRVNRCSVLKLMPLPEPGGIRFSDMRLTGPVLGTGHPSYRFFRELLDELQDESISRRPGYALAVRACCDRLALGIVRLLDWEPLQGGEHEKIKRRQSLLHTLNRYLEEHYAEPVSLEAAAAACAFSPSYFSRLFRENCGESFLSYLTGFRLKKAASLLLMGELNVTEIALACGFGTPRTFNRICLARWGMTPSRYRHTCGVPAPSSAPSPPEPAGTPSGRTPSSGSTH